MEDGRTAKVNIDDWAFIPMLPFGLLAGYWGTMEVRITALAEEGFQIRLAHPASEAQKQEPPELAFYDYHTASYHRLPICDARLVRGKTRSSFFTDLYVYNRTGSIPQRGTAPCDAIQPLYPLGRRKVTTQCSRRR